MVCHLICGLLTLYRSRVHRRAHSHTCMRAQIHREQNRDTLVAASGFKVHVLDLLFLVFSFLNKPCSLSLVALFSLLHFLSRYGHKTHEQAKKKHAGRKERNGSRRERETKRNVAHVRSHRLHKHTEAHDSIEARHATPTSVDRRMDDNRKMLLRACL